MSNCGIWEAGPVVEWSEALLYDPAAAEAILASTVSLASCQRLIPTGIAREKYWQHFIQRRRQYFLVI